MDILERIKKLHALSQRNDSTAQASAAAEKIQELCFKHNVDLIDALGKPDPSKYERFDYILPQSNANIGWRRALVHGIAKANFCHGVTISGTSKVGIVGEKHNFEIVTYLYEYLEKEINRLAKEGCRRQAFLNNRDKRQYVSGFCEGAVQEIRARLNNLRQRQTAENEKSTALVLVSDKALSEALTRIFPRLRNRRRRVAGSGIGQAEGAEAGKRIPINTGIHSARQQSLLN